MFPLSFNRSQIGIGQNWSIVVPLRANHSYHAYCYGEWVDNGSEPKTDYDLYVYDPVGQMVGYHTEAAGLPEHLGNTVDEPFFTPQSSGNYTFVIRNDPRESKSSEQATFMLIEDVEPNIWHEHYVEGKDNDSLPVLETSWAYEFATDSPHIEVWVKVPENLDMYETRLYLMADSQSVNATLLNDVPLAWEPGLYGEKNDTYGGYNLESKEYRGVAYASCEFFGQDMFLNFTSPRVGKSLYHLVFIGETGSGTIEFLVKTEFANACLKPSILPGKVYPGNETAVEYISNSTDLRNATLWYSTSNWVNETKLTMDLIDNRTCRAIIPRQAVGTFVSYRAEAIDILENLLNSSGSYYVKNDLFINLSLPHETVPLGENVTVRGIVTPSIENLPLMVYFNSANGSVQVACYTDENGVFRAGFKPDNIGSWTVQASFSGDEYLYESTSQQLTADVEEPSFFAKYSLYIGGGMAAASIVGAIVYYKKFKG